MYNSKLILVVGLVIAGTLLTTTGGTSTVTPVYAQIRADCIECFDPLSDSQVQQLAEALNDIYGTIFGGTRSEILDQICEALEVGRPDGLNPSQVNKALKEVDNVSKEVRSAVVKCLKDVF